MGLIFLFSKGLLEQILTTRAPFTAPTVFTRIITTIAVLIIVAKLSALFVYLSGRIKSAYINMIWRIIGLRIPSAVYLL